MTATSMPTPTVATTSWKALQRFATMIFAIIVFSVVAFSVGRASVHARHLSPAIAPASISAPAPSGTPELRCQLGRTC